MATIHNGIAMNHNAAIPDDVISRLAMVCPLCEKAARHWIVSVAASPVPALQLRLWPSYQRKSARSKRA